MIKQTYCITLYRKSTQSTETADMQTLRLTSTMKIFWTVSQPYSTTADLFMLWYSNGIRSKKATTQKWHRNNLSLIAINAGGKLWYKLDHSIVCANSQQIFIMLVCLSTCRRWFSFSGLCLEGESCIWRSRRHQELHHQRLHSSFYMHLKSISPSRTFGS